MIDSMKNEIRNMKYGKKQAKPVTLSLTENPVNKTGVML